MNVVKIYKSEQSVFDMKDLSIILAEENYNNLKAKINYYVKKWYINRIRRWIFVKDEFDVKELACKIYSPSYISFETILQEQSVIFQYDATIYLASYLNRLIEIEYKGKIIKIQYRKIKDELLYNQDWIIKKVNYTEANTERAIKDMQYLKPNFYFDNLPNGTENT